MLLPFLETPASAAADAISAGVYGRNERVVVPILGDLMGVAAPGGPSLDRATVQLGMLAESLAQLEALDSPTLETLEGVGVLRLSAIYFKTTPATMELTAKLMESSTEEIEALAALTADFEASVAALEQSCRTSDGAGQLAAAKRAAGQLARYLEVASARYTVPKVSIR